MRLRYLAFIVIAAGCAPKGPSPQFVAEIAKADALVQQGCYTCLKEALAIYDKHAAAKVPIPGAREGQFEAALLIAIREKELGIPGDESMARARKLVLPSRQLVLDAAELIIGDTTGLDPDQRALVTGRNRPQLEPDNPKRRALDGAPENDITAKYVALSIDCEQPKLSESLNLRSLADAYAGVPLMRFRLSTCGRPNGTGCRRPSRRRSALERFAALGRAPRADIVARPRHRLPESDLALRAGPRGVPGVVDAGDGVRRTRT